MTAATLATRDTTIPATHADVDWQELAMQVDGELRWDPIQRCLYASSASIIEIWPSAVLVPKSFEDVHAAMAFCARWRVPVTCRGAGSGVVGQSLGRGLIIDFSVHLNRIIEINTREQWAYVEPGVVKDDLDSMLALQGMFWPPDPSSSPWCTVGAMVANNSGGAKSVRYGTARDYLMELECLDWQGEPFKLRPLEIAPEGRILFPADASPTEQRLAIHAYRTIRQHRDMIRAHQPEATRCSSGYNIFQVLPLEGPLPGDAAFEVEVPSRHEGLPLPPIAESGCFATGSPWVLDMPRLFCGSEGSLGVLLRAKVRVLPLPKAVAGCSLSFESDERMAHAVVALLANTRPAKLELLDRSFIDVAAKAEPELAAELPAKLKTLLVAEYFGESKAECAAQVDAAMGLVTTERFTDGTPLAFATEAAYEPKGLDKLWRIRKIASPILSRVKGDTKPTRWVEDIAVPPWKLPEFIAGLTEIFRRNGFPAALFGHAGEGNLHVNPKANVKDPECRERMLRAADEAHALTKSLNGVISGEHGDGTMRSPHLKEMFGPAYDVMVEIKREWDPHWLMNPLTKVLPDSEVTRRHILTDARVGEGYSRHETGTSFDRPSVLEEVEKCHGCGKCRTYCPLMSVGKEEKYTARAKANLLRAVVSGKLDADTFLTDREFAENIDLCINCGQCLVECPTQVDIPGIAIAFRDQLRERGEARDGVMGGVLARPDRLGKVATVLPSFTNGVLKSRFVRGAAQLATGLDERRTMPEYRNELGVAERAKLVIPSEVQALLPKEIALFPGCWANYNDPDGERNSLVRILQALDIVVHLPQVGCCGISKITQGMRDAAKKELSENVRVLLPFVSRGALVLFSAPSCLLASTHDLPRIVETPEAAQVAKACTDAHKFLRTIFQHPDMRAQLKPLPVGLKQAAYHQPCHSKVNGVGREPLDLVALIPEEKVTNLDAGCCGLSGTFGMKTNNFDMSMKIGAKLFGRIESVKPDVVFTPCGVCQTQIHQGSPDATVVHPLRLLYEALL